MKLISDRFTKISDVFIFSSCLFDLDGYMDLALEDRLAKTL